MSEEKNGTVIIPSSPADRQKMKIMIEEMTHCMARMDLERGSMKDIADKIKEDFQIPAKTVNKLARTMYKHNYSDVQAENEDFELLYENIVGAPNNFTNEDV